MRPYSPGGRLTALAPARRGSSPPTPSLHRLLRGLPGYLIPFAPHAFAPQRQGRPSRPPSPRVFLPISTHFTTTPGIPPPSAALQPRSLRRPSPVEPGAFTPDLRAAACARFTPSKSGQRSPPTYYRGCWHVVSRALFLGYRHSSSPRKGVYTPKGVIPHAALLRQACAHCGKFLAAASRRSLGRVSVPVWLVVLSDQLPIIALVGRYPTN